jgi:cold shock CspA family protein
MAVQGEMLWFNVDKGYGFIQTEDDERLYVAASGFRDGELPEGRCKGMAVVFDKETAEGDPRAVEVRFLTAKDSPRARLRHPRGGTSI